MQNATGRRTLLKSRWLPVFRHQGIRCWLLPKAIKQLEKTIMQELVSVGVPITFPNYYQASNVNLYLHTFIFRLFLVCFSFPFPTTSDEKQQAISRINGPGRAISVSRRFHVSQLHEKQRETTRDGQPFSGAGTRFPLSSPVAWPPPSVMFFVFALVLIVSMEEVLFVKLQLSHYYTSI